MKIKLVYFLSAVILIGYTSCEKDTGDTSNLSRITYFPEFKLEGGSVVVVNEGSNYKEPGVVVTEGGKEIEFSKAVKGKYFGYSGNEVDATKADLYEVTYSAKNSDGYPGSTSRTVIVAPTVPDLKTTIAGVYTCTVTRNNASGAQYTNMKYVVIRKTGEKTYLVSDAIGAYYDLGRGYGTDFIAPGLVVTANDIPANNFSFSSGVTVGTFGGEVEVTSMKADADAGTLSLVSVWNAGSTVYTFKITLTPVKF